MLYRFLRFLFQFFKNISFHKAMYRRLVIHHGCFFKIRDSSQASFLVIETCTVNFKHENLKISPALYYSKLSAFFQRTLEIIYKMHPNKIIAEHKDLEFSKY
jgi:hypothetical protein